MHDQLFCISLSINSYRQLWAISMSGYDFSALSPPEFEELTRDLLQVKYGVPFQAFTEGPDGGIDLRHSPVSNENWIVQCKHFAKSRYSSLKSHLKKELRKIQKLSPKRYILVTSLGLTPKNVDDLFDLLQPYCISKHDIIGKDDLNGILRDNPEIEKSHFKLWITSEPVLSRVLHNDVIFQSAVTEDEIRKRLGLYVYTDMYRNAKNKLESDRVCIVSGIPGVGKTTLAEMLLVDHLVNGWQLVTINQNITEALRMHREDPNSKQIFYYDDFLGQIKSGAKLAKNEDRTLLQLMKSISSSKSKRFILTTREYILAQAKEEHEQLARSNIDVYQFVIECTDYNVEAKARILANHLYHFGVPQKYIAAIIKNERYREIINHPNYSPRIIELRTDTFDFKSCTPSRYPDEFVSKLNNPSEIWLNAYNHLSDAARHLLLSLVSCGDAVYLKDLKRVFESFWGFRSNLYGLQRSPNDYMRALKELDGNFFLIHEAGEERVLELHNPSVLDFIEGLLQREPDTIGHIVESAISFDQIMCLTDTLGIMKHLEDASVPSNTLLGDVVTRTFASDELTVSAVNFEKTEWEKQGVSQWWRLRVCIQLANQADDRHLRNIVECLVNECFNQLLDSHEDFDLYIDILKMQSNSSWVTEATKENLLNIFKQELLSDDGLCSQTLEDLSSATSWIADNRHGFTEKEYEECIELLSKYISSDIDELRSENDRDVLESVISTLEVIESNIDLEFTSEKVEIYEMIDNCPFSDPDEGYSRTNPVPRTASDNTSDESIKSIFNSLIK